MASCTVTHGHEQVPAVGTKTKIRSPPRPLRKRQLPQTVKRTPVIIGQFQKTCTLQQPNVSLGVRVGGFLVCQIDQENHSERHMFMAPSEGGSPTLFNARRRGAAWPAPSDAKRTPSLCAPVAAAWWSLVSKSEAGSVPKLPRGYACWRTTVHLRPPQLCGPLHGPRG